MKNTFVSRIMKEAEKEGIFKSRVQTFLLREELIKQLDQIINGFSSNAEPNSIKTNDVVLELRDPSTGCIFRRELPLDVEESANGLMLKGESLSGKPSEIVFISGDGAGRIKDLMGGGPDVDRCGGHGGHDH